MESLAAKPSQNAAVAVEQKKPLFGANEPPAAKQSPTAAAGASGNLVANAVASVANAEKKKTANGNGSGNAPP